MIIANEINSFIDCLRSRTFKKAGKIEHEIIREEVKATGLCYNFLVQKPIDELGKYLGQTCNTLLPPTLIHKTFDICSPDSTAPSAYVMYEKQIIDYMNETMDKYFIQALDEHTPEPVKRAITPATLIGQICSMMGNGQKVYAVLWNPENYDRAAEDPNWKGVIPSLIDWNYAGWKQNFLNNFSSIRNFVSLAIPLGTIYLVDSPQSLGHLFIEEKVDVAETLHSFFEPITISIDFQMKISINTSKCIVKIQEKKMEGLN